jgi:hypothetical protein
LKKRSFILFLFIVLLSIFSGCAGALRESYVKEHPELDGKTKKAILAEKIIIGMSKEEVIASWGNPHDINKSVGSWGVHEQWVYGYWSYNVFIPTSYLYFENEKLTGWQQ